MSQAGITFEEFLDSNEAQLDLLFKMFPGPDVEITTETETKYKTRINQLN